METQLVGAVLCGHDGRRGYMHHLAVQTAYRRQGIGQALVEHCLARLKAAGIDKCHIFVYSANQAGQAFWKKTGWVLRANLVLMSRRVTLADAALDLYEEKLKEFIRENHIQAEHLSFDQSCHSVAEAALAVHATAEDFVKNICLITKAGDLMVAIVKGEDRTSLERIGSCLGDSPTSPGKNQKKSWR